MEYFRNLVISIITVFLANFSSCLAESVGQQDLMSLQASQSAPMENIRVLLDESVSQCASYDLIKEAYPFSRREFIHVSSDEDVRFLYFRDDADGCILEVRMGDESKYILFKHVHQKFAHPKTKIEFLSFLNEVYGLNFSADLEKVVYIDLVDAMLYDMLGVPAEIFIEYIYDIKKAPGSQKYINALKTKENLRVLNEIKGKLGHFVQDASGHTRSMIERRIDVVQNVIIFLNNNESNN